MTAHLVVAVLLLVAVNLAAARLRHHARGRRHQSLLYRTYLRSPLWRIRRRLWITQAFGRCQNCGRFRRPLTIHHLTYARLGREGRGDIQVLCWPCHRQCETHKQARRRRSKVAR